VSQLFSPAKLRGMELPNRIVVSPMCQYSAKDGAATDWHMVHLNTMALSGAGLVIIEATAVEPEGRITPGCLGLFNDETEAALRPVIEAMRRYSKAKVVMQVAHAGRKASSFVPWEGGQQLPLDKGGWLAFAPSAIPHKDGEVAPVGLDEAGLARVKNAFVETAKRAERLGLDGLELHGAHGYLMHEFLSPLSNQRTDAYGGSLENRMRFPLEVFDAVRAVFPADKPIGMRVSGTDWVDGGWDIEQTIAFVKELEKRGADWIDVSSGGVSPLQKIPVGPGYQVPLAEAVKKAVSMPVFSVGLITEPKQAEEIIASGKADFVALARGTLYDPRWAWHAAAELGATAFAPPQYWRAAPHGAKGVFGDVKEGGR